MVSSSLVNIEGLPDLYKEGLRIFANAASSFSWRSLLNLERLNFPKFVVRAISHRDIFRSLKS